MERLHKFMAAAGVASRRRAEQMVLEGRVSVNGEIVGELGRLVDPGHDAVKVDGKRIVARNLPPIYLALNKPRGVVTTMADPQGRPTVADLVERVRGRVFPVGRLDFDSEGLLLFTDDGELANRLSHPRGGVEKTYAVKVRGRPDAATIQRLQRGMVLDGRRTRVRIRLTRAAPNSWLEVTLTEGRKHVVRRLLRAVGHPVQKLRRTRYDGVRLGALASGAVRPLTATEIDSLRQSAFGARGGPRTGLRLSP